MDDANLVLLILHGVSRHKKAGKLSDNCCFPPRLKQSTSLSDQSDISQEQLPNSDRGNAIFLGGGGQLGLGFQTPFDVGGCRRLLSLLSVAFVGSIVFEVRSRRTEVPHLSERKRRKEQAVADADRPSLGKEIRRSRGNRPMAKRRRSTQEITRLGEIPLLSRRRTFCPSVASLGLFRRVVPARRRRRRSFGCGLFSLASFRAAVRFFYFVDGFEDARDGNGYAVDGLFERRPVHQVVQIRPFPFHEFLSDVLHASQDADQVLAARHGRAPADMSELNESRRYSYRPSMRIRFQCSPEKSRCFLI